MKRFYHIGLMGLIMAITIGCSATGPRHDSAAYSPTMPLPPNPVEERNGSLYQENIAIGLFEDAKARRIGDILTVILTEQTNASKKASTNTDKTSSIAIEDATLFGRPFNFNAPWNNDLDLTLGAEIDSSQSFAGDGDSSLSNTLSGRITVTVADVLSNGYLLVKGEKRLTINQGDEYVQISGIVRPSDIRPDNTVLSTLVADARISYTGDGVVDEANKMGVITRFFNKWWPL